MRSVGFGGMDQVVWDFGGRGKALCACACKEFYVGVIQDLGLSV